MYRLPTEAEWEYACRAQTITRYCFGDDEANLGEYGWYEGNSHDGTHPVGEKLPNRFGLYDLHGNVCEWCSDSYTSDYYKRSPVEDPRNADEAAHRVARGGSWDGFARGCRSAHRFRYAPDYRDINLGFRVAQELSSG